MSMSNKCFRKLERNTDGDVLTLSAIFYLLSSWQVEQLTSDDWSRYWEYVEEMNIEYEIEKRQWG
jgi:hypothetical protein